MNILIASVLGGALLASGYLWQSRRTRWRNSEDPVIKKFVPTQAVTGIAGNVNDRLRNPAYTQIGSSSAVGVSVDSPTRIDNEEPSADMAESDVAESDMTEFDVAESDVAGFDEAEYDVVESDMTEFDVAEFDMAESDVAGFDEAEFDVARPDSSGEQIGTEDESSSLLLYDQTEESDQAEEVTYFPSKLPVLLQRIAGWVRSLVAWGIQIFDKK